jgi:hypothetical protein
MPTEKAAIAEILKGFDPKNDKLWTDDGSPLVSEVQRLANDKNITRAQINEALPGFARAAYPAGDETGVAPAVDGGTVLKNTTIQGDADDDGFDPQAEPEVNGPGEPLTESEVRAVLTRRVRDAEGALQDARRQLSEAQQHMFAMEKRLTRAMIDHQRRFPPITAAANIKAHLERQTELRREAAGLDPKTGGKSQVDLSMERSNRRGWTRPVRPVNNAA